MAGLNEVRVNVVSADIHVGMRKKDIRDRETGERRLFVGKLVSEKP